MNRRLLALSIIILLVMYMLEPLITKALKSETSYVEDILTDIIEPTNNYIDSVYFQNFATVKPITNFIDSIEFNKRYIIEPTNNYIDSVYFQNFATVKPITNFIDSIEFNKRYIIEPTITTIDVIDITPQPTELITISNFTTQIISPEFISLALENTTQIISPTTVSLALEKHTEIIEPELISLALENTTQIISPTTVSLALEKHTEIIEPETPGEDNGDVFPTVDVFDVTPKFLALNDDKSFKISYSVSDDNGLKRVELWIAKDKDGEPDHSTWDFAKDDDGNNIIIELNGEKSYSGSFTHKPKEAGAYWYGIHVVDNYVDDIYKDGHCNDESNSKCGAEPSDNKAIRVVLAELDEQPILKAPWIGIAKITQGNNGEYSHKGNTAWALDIIKEDIDGKSKPFFVLAAADGKVITVDNDPGGDEGKKISILHNNGYVTNYLHLNETYVKEGEDVKQGWIIGKSGNTGNTTGIHLHFSLSTVDNQYTTIPIERLLMKRVDIDNNFREYNADNNELDDGIIGCDHTLNCKFESNNIEHGEPFIVNRLVSSNERYIIATVPHKLTIEDGVFKPQLNTTTIKLYLDYNDNLVDDVEIAHELSLIEKVRNIPREEIDKMSDIYNIARLKEIDPRQFTKALTNIALISASGDIDTEFKDALELLKTTAEMEDIDDETLSILIDITSFLSDIDIIQVISGLSIKLSEGVKLATEYAFKYGAGDPIGTVKDHASSAIDQTMSYYERIKDDDNTKITDSKSAATFWHEYYNANANYKTAKFLANKLYNNYATIATDISTKLLFLANKITPLTALFAVDKVVYDATNAANWFIESVCDNVSDLYEGNSYYLYGLEQSAITTLRLTGKFDDVLDYMQKLSEESQKGYNECTNIYNSFPISKSIEKVGDALKNLRISLKDTFSKIKDKILMIIPFSPIEVSVYDSQGRVSGVINGTIKLEIPGSFYIEEYKILFIANATDTYTIKSVGTDKGEYGLLTIKGGDENNGLVEFADVEINPNEVHQYNIDFNNKSYEQKIDKDNDGIFEEVISNKAPTAIIESLNSTIVDKPITFNASNSYDDKEIIEYIWNFGDNTTSNEPIINHTYTKPGTYLVTLTVKDNNNAIDTTSKIIDVYANFTLNIHEGWNMISIPLEPIDDISEKLKSYYIYTWNSTTNSYMFTNNIEPYKGYWLLSFNNASISIIGKPIYSIDIDLKRGWHMIGSIYNNGTLSFEPSSNGYNIAYTWDAINNNYILSDKIEPGKGYWILVLDDARVMIE